MTPHATSTTPTEINSLLQRLNRHSASTLNKQGKENNNSELVPNAALASLGRRLAWLVSQQANNDNNGQLHEIMIILSRETMNPSVPYAFFSTLLELQNNRQDNDAKTATSTASLIDEPTICHWITAVTSPQSFAFVNAAIRYYASISTSENYSSSSTQWMELCAQLSFSTRVDLTCEWIRATFSNNNHCHIRRRLSPLVVSTLWNNQQQANSSGRQPGQGGEEGHLLLGQIKRYSTIYFRQNQPEDIARSGANILEWMVNCLSFYFRSNPTLPPNNKNSASYIGREWTMCWIDLFFLWLDKKQKRDHDSNEFLLFAMFLERVVLPFLSHDAAIIRSTLEVFDSIHTNNNNKPSSGTDSAKLLFQLAALILSNPDPVQQSLLLELLVKLEQSNRDTNNDCFGFSHLVEAMLGITLKNAKQLTITSISLVEIWGLSSKDEESLLRSLTQICLQTGDNYNGLSSQTQNALLLIGCCCLLRRREKDKLGGNEGNNHVEQYVLTLLKQFPHLSISLLSILLMDWIPGSSTGDNLLHRLDFLCQSVVQDAHCAQQVWNLVAESVHDGTSLDVRLASIRCFSTLCACNSRLYRRIVDTMGQCLAGPASRQVELRLAIASTVCQLAEQDLIRDVADVIGWIQSFLQETELPTLVHLAVTSLHYLVQQGELDFDVVIKVLSKRLVAIGDVERVLTLHPIVLEALVLLLGDGEIKGDEEEEDEEEEEEEEILSPQVKAAVSTLIAVVQSELLKNGSTNISPAMARRIRNNIYLSLSNYSLEALGLDGDCIPSVVNRNVDDPDAPSLTSQGTRYVALRDIIQYELELDDDETSHAEKLDEDPLVKLTERILYQEEETLGTSIWQKGVKRAVTEKGPKKMQSLKTIRSTLPKPGDIYEEYTENPLAATAIAALLCFDGADLDLLGDLIGDLNETLDPHSQVLCLQGWLQAMARVWHKCSNSTGSIQDELSETVETIKGWLDVIVDNTTDYVYLALAALAIYIPDNFQKSDTGIDISFSAAVEELCRLVQDASGGHEFANKSLEHMALALISCRTRDMAHLVELEKTACLNDASIGTFVGMGLVAMALSAAREQSVQAKQKQDAFRILGVLLEELFLCGNRNEPDLITLVACIKSGRPMPQLLQRIGRIEKVVVQETAAARLNMIALGLSACVSVIEMLHKDLIACTIQALQLFPPSSSISIVLVSLMKHETTQVEDISDTMRTMSPSRLILLSNGQGRRSKNWVRQQLSSLNISDGDKLAISSLVGLVGTFPLQSLHARDVFSTPQLHHLCTADDIGALVEYLGKHDSGSIGWIVRGFLASFSLPAIAHSSSAASNEREENIIKNVSLSRLPTPHPETLIFRIVGAMEDLIEKRQNHKLARRILCLCKLSLPSQFAVAFIEPILKSVSGDDSRLQRAIVLLLVSQYNGRRRATFAGTEFVSLGTRVLVRRQDGEGFVSNHSFRSICRSMDSLLRRCATDSVGAVVNHSWNLCMQADSICIKEWLCSIKNVLSQSANKATSVAPKTLSLLCKFLLTTAIDSLAANMFSGEKKSIELGAVIEELVLCWEKIPPEKMAESSVFEFPKKSTATSSVFIYSLCISLLVKRGFLKGSTAEKTLKSMVVWFASAKSTKAETEVWYKTCCQVARNTSGIDKYDKKELVLLVLEAMLVHGPETQALDLLTILLVAWGDVHQLSVRDLFVASQSINGLSSLDKRLIDITKENLGEKLRSLTKSTKSEAVVSNLLVRIFHHWSNYDTAATPRAIIVDLLNAINTVQGRSQDCLGIIVESLSSE